MDSEHIGVCIIVLSHDGKQVLLGERLNSYKAGMLGLPGGRLELKEALAECGKRELREEVSLEAKSIKNVGVVREWQGTYNFIHFVFVCDSFQGQPVNIEPDKCKGWEWYSIDRLPQNILPGHAAALDIYINKTILKELLD